MGNDEIYQCAWGSEKLRGFPFIPERDRGDFNFSVRGLFCRYSECLLMIRGSE